MGSFVGDLMGILNGVFIYGFCMLISKGIINGDFTQGF